MPRAAWSGLEVPSLAKAADNLGLLTFYALNYRLHKVEPQCQPLIAIKYQALGIKSRGSRLGVMAQ